MAVMAIYRRNDISAQLYSQYRAAVPVDTVPRGALAHAYGRTGPSSFVVVDIWEDADAMAAFIEGSVRPATEALGVDFQPPEIIPVDFFLATPATAAYLRPFVRERETA
jgi:hypothetical protein